jgi:hypothetical protein
MILLSIILRNFGPSLGSVHGGYSEICYRSTVIHNIIVGWENRITHHDYGDSLLQILRSSTSDLGNYNIEIDERLVN